MLRDCYLSWKTLSPLNPLVTLCELLEVARQFLFYSWVSTHMATSLCFQNSYEDVGKASLLFRKEIWVVVGEDLVLT